MGEHNDDHNDSNNDHNDSNDDHNDAKSAEAAETDETAAADAGAEQSARKRRDNHSSEEHNDSNDDHNDDQNNDHNDDKHNDHNDDKAMDKEWHMKWFDSNNYDYKSENFHFNSEIHYANWFPASQTDQATRSSCMPIMANGSIWTVKNGQVHSFVSKTPKWSKSSKWRS